MAYHTDQDWTDEAEAEQSAGAPRGGAASLGVPIVTAMLGLLVGVLGTSLWWTWAGSTSPQRSVAAAPAAAPAQAPALPKAMVAAPAAASAVLVEPTPVMTTAPRDGDDTGSMPVPPAAGPAASAAPTLSAEEVARRRERAWARFYKRPSTCEGNPTGDQLVECGNHYIRMRREFDERWRAGNL